ncbi:hypothetical protein pgond44_00920 [Psychroflexus gondwanensis ACAM 44]|jgi:transposase-like protein|uniref:Insertion element IS150 protein InsJ-like helix-turn-helix domain-containing protein n=1 Tax=Psychroflexus gondwanensis ACAM 44 TaxID=1189619 RepID=N1WZP1_9FLAO|nr:helix-turn-helix domain-containing protein [Psychroflexus gondwanensis]EMY82642.1 hypothetical protein pgond44_00920 [Psychroflexus gondwanensis ACAM 44]
MQTSVKSEYVKRTQKDYSLSFKLQVVEEIESGQLGRLDACHKYGIQARSTITQWLRKYGTFDWDNLSREPMSKTPEQKILELEAKVRLLEKQKARAEHLAERADKKVIIFDMLVDMAEKEYDIQIRKNYTPELLKTTKDNTKKR